MDSKKSTPLTPKKELVSRFGRKISPKKKFDNSSPVTKKTSSSSDDDGIFQQDLKKDPGKGKQLLKKECTPKKDEEESKGNLPPKTPYSLRQRITSRIHCEIEQEEDGPFSASEESDWDESDSESSESGEDEATPCDVELPRPSRDCLRRTSARPKSEYVCGSDYLEKARNKPLTSSHRLSQIEDVKEITKILSTYRHSHESHVSALEKRNQSLFYKWMYALSKGYNILVYGLGSKKRLLDNFGSAYLDMCKVLTINGYFPGLTFKDVLSSLFDIIGKRGKETLEEFHSCMNQNKAPRVFLLVHNIDGLTLRDDKTQTSLSHIASHKKIHIVASIDHINAPLLWDQKKLSRFNFIWEDCSTYQPYNVEKCFEGSFLAKSSSSKALSSLRNVFNALNKNSRSIFKHLMEHALNPDSKHPGMSFSELYQVCRRDFVVSSDLALRAHLTEFLDHQLVRWKKESDMLTVCIDKDVLKTFKSEIESGSF